MASNLHKAAMDYSAKHMGSLNLKQAFEAGAKWQVNNVYLNEVKCNRCKHQFKSDNSCMGCKWQIGLKDKFKAI